MDTLYISPYLRLPLRALSDCVRQRAQRTTEWKALLAAAQSRHLDGKGALALDQPKPPGTIEDS